VRGGWWGARILHIVNHFTSYNCRFHINKCTELQYCFMVFRILLASVVLLPVSNGSVDSLLSNAICTPPSLLYYRPCHRYIRVWHVRYHCEQLYDTVTSVPDASRLFVVTVVQTNFKKNLRRKML
jgi:hypothetical protein